MTKKIVSWDDLEGVEDAFTKTIKCPKLSDSLGQEIFVKVRALDGIELLKALNFPMDEINQMVAEDAKPEVFAAAVQEHAKTFSVQELLETMESVIKVGLVEPDPSDGHLKRLSPDFETIFAEIVAATVPKEAAGKAAGFRPNGE